MAGSSSVQSSKDSRKYQYPWEDYLKVKNKGNQLENFDGEFDLPEEKIILTDIMKLSEKMNISNEEKSTAVSTMQLIITYYSKKHKKSYKSNNGWLKILVPLILVKHTPPTIYNLFEAIIETHIPYDNNCDRILRLLFLYHDPELAQFIVRKRVFFGEFSAEWTSSLFANICKHETTLTLWKFLFRHSEPLIFYLVLVVVIHYRKKILTMKNENKATISNTLATLPQYIDVNEALRICQIAEFYKKSTPFSFEYEFYNFTFGPANYQPVPEFLCTRILIDELAIEENKIISKETSKNIQFCIIDCRPADQYNAGHLPNSINLDYSIHYQNPSEFADKIDDLLNFKLNTDDELLSAVDLHFCFMGSGHEDDNLFISMIIDSILETHLKYVSVLKNGYNAIHNFFYEDIDDVLVNHSDQNCLVCNVDNTSVTPQEERKFLKTLKKMAVWNREGSKSPAKDTKSTALTFDSAAKSHGFRIALIEEYFKHPELLHSFKCQQILDDKEYKSYLMLTKSSIHVLRLVKKHEDMAYVISIKSLSDLMRISESKDRQDLIIIKYGSAEGNDVSITERHRFLISNGKEVVKLISKAVVDEMKMMIMRPSSSKNK